MEPAKRLLSIEDLIALPGDARAELIDGEIVQKALPGGKHADIEGAILGELRKPFHRRSRNDGTGGWWIMPDVTIHYQASNRALIADIAGWRRETTAEKPKDYPVRLRPDWICEVSHSTWKKDTTTVLQTLQSEGVAYYWIADVEKSNLLVFELVGNQYALAQSLFPDSGTVRIKPFEAIELNVRVLFGEDED